MIESTTNSCGLLGPHKATTGVVRSPCQSRIKHICKTLRTGLLSGYTIQDAMVAAVASCHTNALKHESCLQTG